MTLKVAHILDHFLPYHSGYVYRTLSIIKALRDKGVHQILITSCKHKKSSRPFEEVDGFRVHHTQYGNSPEPGFLPVLDECWQMVRLYQRMKQVYATEKFDIIHAHSPVLNGLPALRIAKRFGLPFVYDIRAFWEDAAASHGSCVEGDLRYKATRYAETYVARRADRVSVICNGLKTDLLERGIPGQKISIQPNGINARHASESASVINPKANGSFTLGYIGSFYEYEGLDLLIDAMAELKNSDTPCKLILVGGYEQADSLRQRVHDLELDDCVQFTGPVPHSDIAQYYALMDLLVFPRRRQRLTELVTPLKPLEAMSYGKPVLASDVGGHKELIQDRENGLLFKADDVQALAAAIGGVTLGTRRTEFIKENAIREALSTKSWPRIVEGYLDIYASLTPS